MKLHLKKRTNNTDKNCQYEFDTNQKFKLPLGIHSYVTFEFYDVRPIEIVASNFKYRNVDIILTMILFIFFNEYMYNT